MEFQEKAWVYQIPGTQVQDDDLPYVSFVLGLCNEVKSSAIREWVFTKADDGPSDNHSASCHGADPDMESGKRSNPCETATEHTSPVVCLIQATM